MIKEGKYCIYNSIEYSFDKVIDDRVLITSYDRNDLNNGFVCDLNEDFIKKYGFYCQKIVPKSEITEAHKIETRAVYKGMTLDIIGGSEKMGQFSHLLAAPYEFPNNPTGEMLEIRNNLVEMGFHDAFHEKTGCMYIIEVDMDDPELELVKERTEIDISKL